MWDLLVSYSWNQYYRAKPEILRLLRSFGDPDPRVEKTSVWGIALVHTSLDNREVIKKCKALHNEDAAAIQCATKWVPVDYWCSSDLDAIKRVIDEQVKNKISEDETWAMKVHKRRWQQYHTSEIVAYLATDIQRKVDLSHPHKLIWVDVIGRETAVSLLGPDDIFSLNLPQL